MPTEHPVIRLVGGPPKVDGAMFDLRVSERDRADAEGGQFVRACKGSTITSLAALQHRCVDRLTTQALASEWRALVYRATGRRVRRRPPVYRFEGYYSLDGRRDAAGRWTLAVCAKLSGETLPPPPSTPSVWTALEAAVSDASARFASVASLVPSGALAERARATRQAVETCVRDADRLCAVGATVAPSGLGETFGEQAAALIARITSLVQTIDAATAHLVELHLDVRDAVDPVDDVAQLSAGWAEVQAIGRPTMADPN
jgi:hypothetical protein